MEAKSCNYNDYKLTISNFNNDDFVLTIEISERKYEMYINDSIRKANILTLKKHDFYSISFQIVLMIIIWN